jgi:hypothetical protein
LFEVGSGTVGLGVATVRANAIVRAGKVWDQAERQRSRYWRYLRRDRYGSRMDGRPGTSLAIDIQAQKGEAQT